MQPHHYYRAQAAGCQNAGGGRDTEHWSPPQPCVFHLSFPRIGIAFQCHGAELGWAGRGAVLKLQLSTMVELYANTATTGYYAAAACLFDVTQCVFAETSR